MKQIFSLLIAFLVAWTPMAGYAAPASTGVVPAASFKQTVDGVIYSLDTMPDVLADLKSMDMEAGRGLNKTAAQSIYVRISAALELLHAIGADDKMTDVQKDAVQRDLFTHIGSAMYRILRQHGNDKVDPTSPVEPVEGFLDRSQLVMKEFLLDAKSLGTIVRSGKVKDPAAASRLRAEDIRRGELEDKQDDFKAGKGPDLTSAEREEVLKLNDAKASEARSYGLIWKPLERVRRVQLGEQVVDRFSELASRYVPEMANNATAQSHYLKFWAGKHIPNIINLRQNRVVAQIATKYTLLGMTVASFLTPDFIGMVNGRYWWSRPATSIVLMTTFGVLTFMKSQTVGKKIVSELRELLDIMNGKASYVAADAAAKTPGAILERFRAKLMELTLGSLGLTNSVLAPALFSGGRSIGGVRGGTCESLFK